LFVGSSEGVRRLRLFFPLVFVKMVNKSFWSASFTLSGTMMGAGILALPFVFSSAGFLSGLFWLLLISFLVLFVNLSLGEVVLRSSGTHQLVGYARRYLGPVGERFMFFSVLFGMYAALLAFLVGQGSSFSALFPGVFPPLVWGIIFWFSMLFVLRRGLGGLKSFELYGVFVVILIVLGLFFAFSSYVDLYSYVGINEEFFFLPVGIVLFSFLGFASIPEMKRELGSNLRFLRSAIVFGTFVPLVLYVLFTSLFSGDLVSSVSEVATLSFGGPFLILLGMFTMATSFVIHSFALRDMFVFDEDFSSGKAFFFSSLLPLLLYVIVELFGFASFVSILGVGGVLAVGSSAILILLMNLRSKVVDASSRPSFVVPMNWFLVVFFSLLFVFAVVVELFL
jgi:tyrosine-specific transport protein